MFQSIAVRKSQGTLCIADLRAAKPPGVTGLAAALGEEGRAVQHHRKAAGHGGAAYDLRGEILHIGIYFV